MKEQIVTIEEAYNMSLQSNTYRNFKVAIVASKYSIITRSIQPSGNIMYYVRKRIALGGRAIPPGTIVTVFYDL